MAGLNSISPLFLWKSWEFKDSSKAKVLNKSIGLIGEFYISHKWGLSSLAVFCHFWCQSLFLKCMSQPSPLSQYTATSPLEKVAFASSPKGEVWFSCLIFSGGGFWIFGGIFFSNFYFFGSDFWVAFVVVFCLFVLYCVGFFCFFFNAGSSRSSDHHHINSFSSYIQFFLPM